jgi:uncharacterized lipoprotein YddW (UPF0748 family)
MSIVLLSFPNIGFAIISEKSEDIIMELNGHPKKIEIESVDLNLNNTKGSLIIWVKLKKSASSRTILSAKWNDDSYIVFSDGWWESSVKHGLYFVVDNQQAAFCFVENYTIQNDKWVLLAVTWEEYKGRHYCKIYIDGEQHTEKSYSIKKTKKTKAAAIFSDKLTDSVLNRSASGIRSNIIFKPYAISANDIKNIYLNTYSRYQDKKNIPSKFKYFEKRVIFDDENLWVLSKNKTDDLIKELSENGFNVYVPCVWNGSEALFKTKTNQYNNEYVARLKRNDDAMKYLIVQAEKKGIEVIPWFIVSLNQGGDNKFTLGSDKSVNNIHDPEFRIHISNVINEYIELYKPKEINLDYFRSISTCLSDKCKYEFYNEYKKLLTEENKNINSKYIHDWNRKSLEDILFKLKRKTIDAAYPTIGVDASLFEKELMFQGQDAPAWIKKDQIDRVFIMHYGLAIQNNNIENISSYRNHNAYIPLISTFDKDRDKIVSRSCDSIKMQIEYFYNNIGSQGIAFYNRKNTSDAHFQCLQGSEML